MRDRSVHSSSGAARHLLSLAVQLHVAERVALRAAFGLLGLVIGFSALHTLLGVGGASLDAPIRDWASSAAYVLVAAIVTLRAVRVREARGAWTAFAAGISLYAAGNLLWALWLEHVPDPPIPSICDALWLSLYPLSYVGVGLLVLKGARKVPAGLWLDGVVAALGLTAVGAAVVFEPVLEAATGSALAVATNLAYPICDLILAGVGLGALALRGWRPDRAIGLLGGGFLWLCVADCLYLLQVAAGTSASSTLANLFYMIGVSLIALAAWQPVTQLVAPKVEGWPMLAVPGAALAAALGLLIWDHLADIHGLAFTLAMLTLVAGMVRTGMTFHDVRTLARTRHQALTDDLTDLPNRRMFRQRLDATLASAGSGEGVALLVIDLNQFKELNDTLGHDAGDALLRQIGPRLKTGLRPSDTVARLGGDEFAVVLASPVDADVASFEVRGLSLRTSASIGVAVWPDHADGAEELLRRADVAMYHAKSLRTGRELYSRERDNSSRDRLTLTRELEDALTAGELEVYFQPIADADTGCMHGVEALVRWLHPQHGVVPPESFVPLAEHAGLARALTRQVVDAAVSQCAAWRRQGNDLTVSVNLTGADLHDSELPGEIALALAQHGLSPEALMLEITERAVLRDPGRIADVLTRIGEMGVGLSLDDFGTGYSSLTHLRTLPVDEVKVDRAFVSKMTTDPADAAIVETTIKLAHALGKRVVAEGVEDEATWQRLADLGCELIQGYVLSRALPASELGLELDRLMGRARA
jgi:diguanylate cyclase (GGDEF)-like protein